MFAWPTLTGTPVPPTFLATVAVVDPGIEIRFRGLCQQIKAGPDYATLAPVLDLSISGGQVNVAWGWQGYRAFLDQCELQVDRADSKGFVLLAIDTTPGYTDTTPFPSAPAKWIYQAIYRVGDIRVGQSSVLGNREIDRQTREGETWATANQSGDPGRRRAMP